MKMPTNVEEKEDYIDMELSLSYSPPQAKEFEFQMTASISQEKQNFKPHADELFYKGKLLKSTTTPPIITTSTAVSTNTSTPLESCHISPSESRRVSSERNTGEFFFEWSTELRGFIGDNPKKCWSKKFKLIKQSSLCQKLKASHSYLTSIFSKSGCLASKTYNEVMKKHPAIANVMKSTDNEDSVSHRRSFSGVIKRRYASLCSSSSSSSSSTYSSSASFNSDGFYELQFLKSSSPSSDIERSIEAAIAHSVLLGNKVKKETVVPDPDYRIPIVLLGLASGLGYTNNLLPAAPAGLLGLLLLFQTTRVRFVFDDEALEVKVGEELDESRENVFVGGKNRWKYSTFVNWELWWPNFPILVYFKETQTKP